MSPPTILVVEDNPITRKMMRFTLESEGYKVAEFGDGSSALRFAADSSPDLVLLDFVLPDTDGLSLLARLRELPGAGELPAVLVTGMVSHIEDLRSRAGPFTSALGKPVAPSRLLEVVRSQLAPQPSKVGRGRRVLVVDDESLNLKLACLRLCNAGFEVDTAQNAPEGLQKARLTPPAAILSDVLMPGQDGFELCRQVREDPLLAHVPVVLLSAAYVDDADQELARQMGASRLVLRTPDFREAIEALEVSLRSGAPPPQRIETVTARHKERVQAQLEKQMAHNDALVRQGAIQSAALSVVRGLTEGLAHPRDLPSLLGDVLVHCLDAAGLSTGLLYLLSADGKLRLKTQSGLAASARQAAEACFGHPELLQDALQRGEPVAYVARDAVARPEVGELLSSLAHTSALVVPFVVLEEPFGAMLLASDSQDLSERTWFGFGRTLAHQFGQAIALGRSLTRLTASEARYQSLLEHANDAILLLRPDYTIIEANQQSEALLGRPRADIVGRAYADFVVPEEREEAARCASALAAAAGWMRIEKRHLLRGDGSRVTVEISATFVRVGDEPVVLAILRDISERERAEEEKSRLDREVDNQRRRLDGIISTIPGVVWEAVAAPEGFQATFVSRHVETLTGYTEAEWLVRPDFWLSIVHPDDRDRADAESRRTFQMGAGTQDFRWITKDGHVIWVQSQIVVLPEESGRPTAMRGVMLDISERKRAEQALVDSERLLRESQRIAHIGSWEWNGAADRITWSEELYRIFGLEPGELEPSRAGVLTRIHAEDRARTDAAIESCMASGRPFEYEYRAVRPDGSLRHVRTVGEVQCDASGRAVRRMGVTQDVTERKQLEHELTRQREVLYQSEKLAGMGQMLAGVAHELNNPLAVVLGQSSLLRRVVAGRPEAERVEKIMNGAERCARIVKNFLALARQHPPERERVAVNQIVEEALELLAYPLKVDGIQVKLELSSALPVLHADGHQLQQVLINLVTNAHHALRAAPGSRCITVSTRRERHPDRVVLELADSGPGIPPELHERIFEPFFTTKPEGQGTGLGLPLCKAIVENHSGTLTLTSAPGKGATFTIALPVGAPRAAPAEIAESPAESVPSHSILVVDDELQVVEVLTDVFQSAGHRVTTAADGRAALSALEKASYDVIVSDLRMPGLDGPGLYREAARLYPGIEKRFVFVTGDTLDPQTRKFLETCSAAHLAKPFSVEEALRVVNAALSKARGQRAD